MKTVDRNDTCELVDLLAGKSTVRLKHVFTINQTWVGQIEQYKAWLMAKDFTQTYRVNYDEIFACMMKLKRCAA